MATASNGNFVWFENLTKDPKAAIAFYTEIIGWKTEAFGGGDYMMWVGSQGPVGGVYQLPEQAAAMGAPPHWIGNVQVADVDAACARVKALGGKVYKEPTDIPTVGRFAVIADPQGAAIAAFKPANPMTVHDGSKPGEFCWSELLTSDSGAAWEFYAQVFGWKVVQDMDMGPMGTYRIFGVGETGIGGMMTTPKGAPMPPMWLHYTETADLDAAIARATKMGAKVMNGPMEVPGGARIAQFLDPQGAAFALHELKK